MIRCSLSFHKSKVNDFTTFATGVRDGIFGNIIEFPTPPIPAPMFAGLIQNYTDKRAAYEKGGSAQKGPYQQAKKDLMEGLDTFAEYVTEAANGNENIILLSGFVPTKGYRSDKPSTVQPTGIILKRPATGVITAECANQKVATNYICIVTINDPLPDNVVLNDSGQLVYFDSAGLAADSVSSESSVASTQAVAMNIALAYIDFNPGRRKIFSNLQLGSRYHFSFAAANAQGVSTFSDPISIICG